VLTWPVEKHVKCEAFSKYNHSDILGVERLTSLGDQERPKCSRCRSKNLACARPAKRTIFRNASSANFDGDQKWIHSEIKECEFVSDKSVSFSMQLQLNNSKHIRPSQVLLERNNSPFLQRARQRAQVQYMTTALGHGILSPSTLPPRGNAPVGVAACFTIPCGKLGNRPRIPVRTPLRRPPLPTMLTRRTLAPLRIPMLRKRIGILPLRRRSIILPSAVKRLAHLGNHANSRYRIPKRRVCSGTLLRSSRIGYRLPSASIWVKTHMQVV
jgi:hypothetical protein